MEPIFVAVDIETLGAWYCHPVVAVGFAIGDHKGNILETKLFTISANWKPCSQGGDMEDRCYNEFWSKHPDMMRVYQKDAVEPPIAWNMINEFINNLEKKYPDKKIKFLTDNAAFDIARIDFNLEKYCKRLPMRLSTTGKYRALYGADDMLAMLPPRARKEADKVIDTIVIHDHNPVNDATYVYHQYIQAIKFRDSLQGFDELSHKI